ncbi:uncharacterized protein N7500_006438 [Penicillium coprophilum]|uniref:uncharacterized protein n=1 Tax=Penicillium coprophilum TaxID=36646 RepID=UPI00238E35E9|nr:uncharacterized protein N7500_006438 [Penicillium coprophilum]KAJ5164608.1 hypothetical protein N7500_006438 [Penicillium coprophilum]
MSSHSVVVVAAGSVCPVLLTLYHKILGKRKYQLWHQVPYRRHMGQNDVPSPTAKVHLRMNQRLLYLDYLMSYMTIKGELQSRFKTDNGGDRVVYLGNCAALSFLQNIQQLIETETGCASIAADVAGLSVIEELPPLPPDDLMAYNSENTEELERLIRVVETVQAFVLISIFMLGCSRRNGASLNLGIAIGAAKSLGYHQSSANLPYDDNERRQRQVNLSPENYMIPRINIPRTCRAQIWKTLRYHDLFFSAMMGRSSSTSDTSFNIDEAPSATPIEDEYDQSLSMTESARAFLVMEHIINDVYTKRTVSLGLLQSLAQELQEKCSVLPKSLRKSSGPTVHGRLCQSIQQRNLRNAHVTCSYYFAMMLLTRPFLITILRAKTPSESARNPRARGANNGGDNDISSEIAHGATTCIDSATYTIQLLHELLTANMLFNNMPFFIAWVFVSVLVLSSAYFGQLDPQRSITRTLRQADDILACFAVNSPQARRYRLILKKLSKAAECQNQTKLQSRVLYMPRLFHLDSDGSGGGPLAAGSISPKLTEQNTGRYGCTLEGEAADGGVTDQPKTCNCCGIDPGRGVPFPQSVVRSEDILNAPGSNLGGLPMTTTNESIGHGSLFQLEDDASIWDFTWAGSL